MIKGVWWHFVLLSLASSLCVATSLNLKLRQKRQLQNAFLFQPLRKGRYLPPIPIRISPHSQKGSESFSSSGGRRHSLWIPLQGSTSEELNSKNVYVPPIRPPATGKAPKNTFDIPLTRSIQVSLERPDMQTTGYIRKNLVKMYATRTTTEQPRRKMLGSLAESTVQTLLNFTPVDEGWRPKSIPTTATPISHFGKNLGSKVDKHLNYTGIRFGKVNTVLKTMPQNGQVVKLSKNETNFVMKFTPEDVKFTSVELQTENLDAPVSVDSPEIQLLTKGYEEQKSFFDGFLNPQKVTYNLRNEGNIPYQGHKTSMDNIPSVSRNTELNYSNEDQKPIFDSKKKNKVQLSDQEFFVKIPVSPEKVNSQYTVRKKNTDQKDKAFVGKPFDRQNMKTEDINKKVSNDNRNFFSRPSNAYGIGSQQQVKSNLPYQGHTNKHVVRMNEDLGGKKGLPDREPQIYFPSSPGEPVASYEETIKSKHPNDPKTIPQVSFSSSPQHIPNNYSANVSYLNIKNSKPETVSHSDNYGLLNSFLKTRTVEKEALTVVKAPLPTGNPHEENSSSNMTTIETITKNNHGNPNKHFKHLISHKYSPHSPSLASITRENISNIHENKNDDQLSSKPAFGNEPNLREVELKNPPKYLQFHDEDFLKPVVKLNPAKDSEKSIGALLFSSGERTKDIEPILDTSRDKVDFSKAQISTSKVEYYKNSKFEGRKPVEKTEDDSTYFQPVFPDTLEEKNPDISRQNYDPKHSSEADSNPVLDGNYLGPLQKISKDVIITKETHYSPKDTRLPSPPPVITRSLDSAELHNDRDPNQRKTTARPRKPKITISTGMLAGILIAALVFLGFLTGSMVYAFHQWKFGRSRSDRQKKRKKVRNPGFPPEYMDENLAGNTYIHNNIFLPTPQNLEERNPSEPDNTSVIGDEEPQTASTRGRRHRRSAELNATRREC